MSFMICGKNDSYLGNFIYRLTTSVNYTARNAARIGRLHDLEIVLVDWNSETPMRHVLPLSQEAAAITRFVEVGSEVCRAESPEGVPFHINKALNVAARRARGQFVAITPADIMFPQLPLMGLLEVLSQNVPTCFDVTKAMLLIGAFGLPWQICEREPSLEEWDRYIQLHARQLHYYNEYPGLACSAAQIIFPRGLYEELKGLDETLPFWGWSDIEIGLRTAQRHPVVDLMSFGVFAYDMRQQPDLRKKGIRRTNPHVVRTEFAFNNDDWGLAAYDLPVHALDYRPPQEARKAPPLAEKAKSLLQHIRTRLASPALSKVAAKVANDPQEAIAVVLVEIAVIATNPKNFLYQGTRHHWPAVAATLQNPTLEIVACDDWTDRPDMPGCSPDKISLDFQEIEFQGVLHFLTGAPSTMPDRLHGLPIAAGGFGLMLLRLSLFGEESAAGVLRFGNWLAPGGVAILCGSAAARAEAVAALVAKQGLVHLLTCDEVEILLRP